MKPCTRKTKGGFVFLSENYNTSFGSDKTVAIISGAVKLEGAPYGAVKIYVYLSSNMNLLTVLRPDQDGSFRLRGVNRDIRLTLVCVDGLNAAEPKVHHKVKPV